MKILFICKKRIENYGVSYGLMNSAKFVCNALIRRGIECKLVDVIDNNHIDKEVHSYKPTHVIIEAYWVVPSKFDVLCKLHPNTKWIVRGHSKIPFFANEGISMKWTREYVEKSNLYNNFFLSFNEKETVNSIFYAFDYMPLYFPNIYKPELIEEGEKHRKNKKESDFIDVGCFGAIRPMKNHLQQAFAAIKFSERNDKILRFHVNGSRIEQNGENIFKNLKALFEDSHHQLISHKWLSHRDFIGLVSSMDIGMQVSFSESFNIVAADFVHNNIPITGSTDIKWLSFLYCANPNDIDNIIKQLQIAWNLRKFKVHRLNNLFLKMWNKKAIKNWDMELGKINV